MFGWIGVTVSSKAVVSNVDGTRVDYTKWSVVGGDPNGYRDAAGGVACVHFGRYQQWLEDSSWGDTECSPTAGRTYHAGYPVCKRALRKGGCSDGWMDRHTMGGWA
jgi:hypothetical protein